MAREGGDDAARADAITWLTRLRSEPSEADCAAFERWYAADVTHADAYDALLESWDAMGLAADSHAMAAEPAKARLWTRLAVAAAAVLALVLAAGLALSRAPQALEAPLLAASRIGEIRTLTLEDGSRVTLDSNSVVRARSDATARRLELVRGRARFEVAHDAARPFEVRAGANTITAHGTVFDVDLRTGHEAVRLLEGAVEVRSASAEANRGTMLAAGQQLGLRGPAGEHPVPIATLETRWRGALLAFEEAPLAEVAAAANRHGQTRILLQGEDINALRFTGTIQTDAPDRTAATLVAMFPVDAERDARGNYVIKPRK